MKKLDNKYAISNLKDIISNMITLKHVYGQPTDTEDIDYFIKQLSRATFPNGLEYLYLLDDTAIKKWADREYEEWREEVSKFEDNTPVEFAGGYDFYIYLAHQNIKNKEELKYAITNYAKPADEIDIKFSVDDEMCRKLIHYIMKTSVYGKPFDFNIGWFVNTFTDYDIEHIHELDNEKFENTMNNYWKDFVIAFLDGDETDQIRGGYDFYKYLAHQNITDKNSLRAAIDSYVIPA